MARKTRGKTTAKIVQAAREQRRKPTFTEEILWEALRNRRLNGLKFRRQHPFGRFSFDVFCVEHELEVEVNGEIHADPIQLAYDAERTTFLQAHGIRVLRFHRDTAQHNLEEVLKQI